jgi:hypothetical protein
MIVPSDQVFLGHTFVMLDGASGGRAREPGSHVDRSAERIAARPFYRAQSHPSMRSEVANTTTSRGPQALARMALLLLSNMAPLEVEHLREHERSRSSTSNCCRQRLDLAERWIRARPAWVSRARAGGTFCYALCFWLDAFGSAEAFENGAS